MDVEVPNFKENIKKKTKRYKSSGSSSFNTTHYENGSFNLNMDVGDDDEEKVQEI